MPKNWVGESCEISRMLVGIKKRDRMNLISLLSQFWCV